MSSNYHQGEIVKFVVKSSGYNLSELARALGVNRRTMYNWFNLKHIKKNIIQQIGNAIKHDFSIEFPGVFQSEDFEFNIPLIEANKQHDSISAEELAWKEKYLKLLEVYNEALLQKAKNMGF